MTCLAAAIRREPETLRHFFNRLLELLLETRGFVRLFHFASWLGRPLRMATWEHKALRLRGESVRFKISAPISYSEFERCRSGRALTGVLREALLSLGRTEASLTDNSPPSQL